MDVVVVGSCNIDNTFAVTKQPKVSETVKSKAFDVRYGGKGANQCIMAARLGAKTAMVGMVGNDQWGKDYRERLNSAHIDTTHLFISKEAATGTAFITVDDSGSNQIVVYGGANEKIQPMDVEKAKEVIVNARSVVCQLEIPSETALAALRLANESGKTTFFNPSPMPTQLPPEFFKYTSVLVVNTSEIEALTGQKYNGQPSLIAMAQAVCTMGVKRVVITLGEEGSFSYGEDGVIITPASLLDGPVVDTTGAGDAFLGALAYFYGLPQPGQESLSFRQALSRATYVAGQTVLKHGAQESYPDRISLKEDLFENID